MPDENEKDDPAENENTTVRYMITAWEWIDEEEFLDPESGALLLSATEEASCMFGDVTGMLPVQIKAEILAYRAEDEENTNTEDPNTESESDTETDPLTPENTTSMNLDIADWVCEEYPKEGAYKGSYTFTTSLPEGYELSEDAKALEVEVLFDAPQLLDAAEGYTEEGFCLGYKWVDGNIVKNSDGETRCSHGDTCNGYQPAVQITDVNKSTYTFKDTAKDYKNYYAITNAGQLYWFAAYVNGWKSGNSNDTRNSNAVLINNITVNSGLLDTDGTPKENAAVRNWTPIGLNNDDVYFQGTFDGQKNTISGIYCCMPDSDKGVGLFGYLNGGTISNVTLTDSYIEGKQSVGGICGKYYGGTLTNCTNDATVIANNNFAGGIVGNSSALESCTISDCINNGKISGVAYVGGVCGDTRSGITMEKCTNTGSVTGTGSYVGGICGSNRGSLKGSRNSGSIEGPEYVGGICGDNNSEATVEECNNNGSVTGTQTKNVTYIRIGGICGNNSGTVKKCKNQTGGAVSVSSTLRWVGGICGVNYKTLEGCTNQATITGYQEVGGICGCNNKSSSTPEIKNCTNEGTVTVYQTEGKNVKFVHIGGVCGENNKGTVTGSSHKGTVSAEKAEHVGGICGENTGTVTESKNESGTVNGDSKVGGICGTSDETISKCTNSGGVTGVDSYVGGICGSNTGAATITDSTNEATGTINGKKMVGGICGNNGSSAQESIKTCENKGGITGDNQVGGICGTHIGRGAIVSCKNVNAEVNGATGVGGICGEVGSSAADVSIKDCESSGSIIGTDAQGYVGGICGVSAKGIADSHNSATVQGENCAGGICGKLNGQSINSCINTGIVTGTSAGGVCGWQCGTINNSTNQAKVTGTTCAGGICSENSGMVQNSKNTGGVSGDSEVGGICGKNKAASCITEIKNCINSASVEGKKYVGGICGYHEGKLISGCSNSGTVTGNGSGGSEVGGICGYSYQFKIMDSCNTGTVSGTNSVGGIVGYAGEVQNAYNTGKVIMTGESRTIGVIYGTGDVKNMSNCYYLDNVTTESGQKDTIHAYDEEATAMTSEQFSSGKVAWLLNGSKSDSPTWYQWIDAEGKTKEASPVLAINRSSDSTGSGEESGSTESITVNYGTVYPCAPCTGVYSNTKGKQAEHGKGEALSLTEEDAAIMHKCSLCGKKVAHSGVVYTADNTKKDTIHASCSCGYSYGNIVLKAPATDESGLVYDGNAKAATVDTTNLTLPTGVTISASETDVTYSKVVNGIETSLTGKPTNAGTYKATLTLTGDDENTATAAVTFTITQATPTVTWSKTSETVSYTGDITAWKNNLPLTITGVNSESIKSSYEDSITYSYRKSGSTGAFITGLPTVCGTYEIKAKVKAKGNYKAAEATDSLKLTIEKANAVITLGSASYTKSYGDPAFDLEVSSNHNETPITYSTQNTDVVTVDQNGKVTIKGAGSATIKVSQEESTNYKKAEDKTVTINVDKKSGYSVGAVTRNYKSGKETTDTLDLKTYLPKDCGGGISYSTPAVTGSIIESSGVTDGVLSYTVKNATTNETGSIKVTIETANYADFTITLNIALTAYDPIEIAGISFSNVTDTSAGAAITVAEGSSPVSKYYLYYTDAVSGSISAESIRDNAGSETANYLSSTGSSFSLTGLKANTTYFVYAVAEDKNGLGTLQMSSFTTQEEPKKPSGGGGSSSGGSGSGSGSSSGSSGGTESSTTSTPQPAPITPQPTSATLLPTPAATQNPLLPESSKPTAGNSLIGNVPEDDADDRNKAPFIKGENGKEGWEIIRTEAEGTPEGSTVEVEMNGAVVVPSEVLSDIQGRDVTLVFDMGNGITWSVNGLDITGEVGDIDIGVTMGAQAGRSIPVEVLNNVTGERTSLNLTLAYEGEFGFTAVLTVNMQAENAGLYANLFYYNPSTGELEFICSDLIREDGTTDLTFTHASDYTIVIDTVPMDGSVKVAEDAPEADAGSTDGSTDGAGNTDSAVTTDAEPAWNPLWIILIGAVVIVIGLGVFVIARKKQEEE